MTSSDLTKFKQENSPLEDGDELDSVFVTSAKIPDEKNTRGGPVYISVGQHIDIHGKTAVKGSATDAVKTAGHAKSVSDHEDKGKRRLRSNDKEHYNYS